MLYVTSPVEIKTKYIYPVGDWITYDTCPAVYATTRKYAALLFSKDTGQSFGKYYHPLNAKYVSLTKSADDDGTWTATERAPNAFRERYMGQSIWIYRVKPKHFQRDHYDDTPVFPELERGSKIKVRIESREFIPDVWEALQKTPIKFVFYHQQRPAAVVATPLRSPRGSAKKTSSSPRHNSRERQIGN